MSVRGIEFIGERKKITMDEKRDKKEEEKKEEAPQDWNVVLDK